MISGYFQKIPYRKSAHVFGIIILRWFQRTRIEHQRNQWARGGGSILTPRPPFTDIFCSLHSTLNYLERKKRKIALHTYNIYFLHSYYIQYLLTSHNYSTKWENLERIFGTLNYHNFLRKKNHNHFKKISKRWQIIRDNITADRRHFDWGFLDVIYF